MKAKCESCQFFCPCDGSNLGRGYCHRFPPQIVFIGMTTGYGPASPNWQYLQPWMEPDDSCGEFKAKESK